MPNVFGVHFPNGTLRNEEIYRLELSHCTLLHMQLGYIGRILAAFDGIILCRFYLPRWSERDPRQWARECATIYRQQPNDARLHYTPANEMNLIHEGGGDTAEWYRRINDWLLAWLDEFRWATGCSPERLHFPAFAYGHSDDQDDKGYVGMEICRAAIEAYGILDVHPYWYEPSQIASEFYGHRFVKAHRRFPTKRIFCSEWGNFNVTRQSTPDEFVTWNLSLYEHPYVIGGTGFIAEDPTGAHWQNDWSRNPRIYQRLKAAHKPEASEWHPDTGGVNVGADERKRYARDIWHRAGVPCNEGSALYKAWYAAYNAGNYWGRPEEPEHPSESGRYVVQAFASRIAYYDTKTGKVGQGLPPF